MNPKLDHSKSPFLDCLIKVIDSYDSLGTYRKFTPEQKLKRTFLLSEEEQQQMISCGQMSEKLKAQISLFFQAVALRIEQMTGSIVGSMVELNDEGFGRSLVYSGSLILINKGIRGTQQFSFTQIDKVEKKGESYVKTGLTMLEKYPEIKTL
ncbi:DUF269 domain-containing protein [Aneurinibacillus terranovensis]|uniref:DUF269 domain-containing protein n=1 Tax=Aneurinibacillus terranovensis TaxID=278991 RepID=UPI00042280A6|nr:DUF269 domain-containing protein [Aneurinibacillus terranovensis]